MFNQLNIIESDLTMRAKVNRELEPICSHIELFEDVGEFVSFLPNEGVVLVNQEHTDIKQLIARLEERGRWFPIVACEQDACSSRVVDTIRAGAIDFIPWPVKISDLRNRADHIRHQADLLGAEMATKFSAQMKIADLSQRETQVLEALATGNSNKGIARLLDISPRTVEIHRANMMGKLEASHSSEAVRIATEAGLTKQCRQPTSLAVNKPEVPQDTVPHTMQ